MCNKECKCGNGNGGCGKAPGYDGLTAQLLAVIGQKFPRHISPWAMKFVIDKPEVAETLLEVFGRLEPFRIICKVTIGGAPVGAIQDEAVCDLIANAGVPEVQECTIVATTFEMLGFSLPVGRRELYARAAYLGMIPIHPLAAVELVKVLSQEDADLEIHIGMNPIQCSDGLPRTLLIKEGKLGTIFANRDERFDQEDNLVFALAPNANLALFTQPKPQPETETV